MISYGIDHDRCMRELGNPLKLEYLGREDLGYSFENGLEVLVSSDSIERYERIMKKNKISTEWMKNAAEKIREGMEKELSLKKVIENIRELREEML